MRTCCTLIMQAGMMRLWLCLVFGSLLRTDEGAWQWDIFAKARDGKEKKSGKWKEKFRVMTSSDFWFGSTSEPRHPRAAVSRVWGNIHRSGGTRCVCGLRGGMPRRQKSTSQCEALYRLAVQFEVSAMWTWSGTASKQSSGKYARLHLSATVKDLTASLWQLQGS